jgi:hypothetical protein
MDDFVTGVAGRHPDGIFAEDPHGVGDFSLSASE